MRTHEEILERKRRYREIHRDELRAKQRLYYYANRDERAECNARIRAASEATKHGRALHLARRYKQKDIEKGFNVDGNITGEWIEENVFNGQRCYYCGESDWKKLGVDRINNNEPHAPGNCIPCCSKCNSDRGRWYSVEEFKEILNSRKKCLYLRPKGYK